MIELIGVFGGIITSSSILPQIFKCWVTKSTNDLSWLMIFLFYIGVILNFTFGILINHPAVFLSAGYSICTNTVLCGMKYYFEIYKTNKEIPVNITYESINVNEKRLDTSL